MVKTFEEVHAVVSKHLEAAAVEVMTGLKHGDADPPSQFIMDEAEKAFARELFRVYLRNLPSYLREFPSFVDEKLPPIPASWTDESWHNDACPCWKTPSGLYVWIDYELVENRELLTVKRFSIMRYPKGDEKIGAGTSSTILATDDWEAVLAALPEGDRT